jgi:hypothetical protein
MESTNKDNASTGESPQSTAPSHRLSPAPAGGCALRHVSLVGLLAVLQQQQRAVTGKSVLTDNDEAVQDAPGAG